MKTLGRTMSEAQGQETPCSCILAPLLVLLEPPHSSQACLTCWWVCMYGNMGTRVPVGEVRVLCQSLKEQ